MSVKFFQLHKNDKKESDNQPDYRISFQVADGEGAATFVEGGACWLKEDKNGKKYMSCKLSDPFKDHTNPSKTRKGYHIEEDEPLTPVKTEVKGGVEEF